MRIIGGRAKGRRLVQPPDSSVRPTSDRIKEALFHILSEVAGLRFLDLFSGTGNVGIEALSRSAAYVVLVERDRSCMDIIRRNLEHCGFRTGFECLALSADRALMHLSRCGESFDVVFMDPPYESGLVEQTLRSIASQGVLSDGGVIVVQRSVRERVEGNSDRLFLEDERRYGDTMLSFWKLLQ